VSNREFALAMLNDATRDNEIAERLRSDGFCDKSVYHFQQAAEKAVKAVLIAMGVFRKTHLIGSALREMAQGGGIDQRWQPALLQAAEFSEELEPDVGLSRYPAIINDALWLPSEEYTPEDAAAASEKAGRVLEAARAELEEFFWCNQRVGIWTVSPSSIPLSCNPKDHKHFIPLRHVGHGSSRICTDSDP
jgi:HEPN domain-containing protein